jgi:hypothetical protein
VIVLLALAWAPLTSHCQLESIPGLEFLHCSPEGHASTGDGGDPCQDGACCSIESAKYQSPRQQQIIPIVLALPPAGCFEVLERLLPVEISLATLTAGPPLFQNGWQFFFRTALSPRAPSLAS